MVGADDTMAWDDDAHAIRADGLRHRPDAFEIPHPLGNLLVSFRLAVWDFEQGIPHLLLEIRPHRTQRNIERLSCTCEILVKLRFRLFQNT